MSKSALTKIAVFLIFAFVMRLVQVAQFSMKDPLNEQQHYIWRISKSDYIKLAVECY